MRKGDRVLVTESNDGPKFREGTYEAIIVEPYNSGEFLVAPVVRNADDRHELYTLSRKDRVTRVE